MTHGFVTQSKVGEWFGISALKVGKILVAHGLKDRSVATEKAIVGGIAKQVTMKNGTPIWIWESGRISRLIDDALGDVEKPFIEKLTAQVGEALHEEKCLRNEGSDFVADLLLEQTFVGVPSGLIGLIRDRLDEAIAHESAHQ